MAPSIWSASFRLLHLKAQALNESQHHFAVCTLHKAYCPLLELEDLPGSGKEVRGYLFFIYLFFC